MHGVNGDWAVDERGKKRVFWTGYTLDRRLSCLQKQVAKARKIAKVAETRTYNAHKRVFAEAAKETRKWRVSGEVGTNRSNRFGVN